jgi:hypothetical protein
VVCCFDFGHHFRSIHLIDPAPGNPLDPIYSFNRLHRYSIRFEVIKIIQTQGKEQNYD